MKKILLGLTVVSVVLLTACSGSFNPVRIETEESSDLTDLEVEAPEQGVEADGPGASARATYMLDRLYVDEQEVDWSGTDFAGSTLMFIGEEAGGNVLIFVGEAEPIVATINPSREHPSFESGIWHHHLYAGVTGGPRINFMEALPHLNIDDNEEATDNTQSIYQRGNLHYVVETGEFRLRLTIGGQVHDLLFMRVQ